ncbi:MAG: response regulator, partial [Bacteroidota bacterium]
FLEKVPRIPVIVLTGINNEIVGNQAVKAGAQDFLVKGQVDGKLLGRSIRYSIQRFKTQIKLEEVARNLAISEKRFVEAQEMAHFGNWEIDIVSNEMKWSDEVYRIFGFNSNSSKPSLSSYLDYVHLEDRPEVEQFFDNATKDGKLHKIEHRIVIDGKTIKHIALQAKVHYEEITGKIILVGALQDITERKLSEQLIIEKNISNKTSKVREEALADMSFHIRTPLSSIVNLLFLMERTQATSQQREYLDGLKTSVDDLSIMINNLLNFSVLVSEKIKVEEEEIMIKDFFQSISKVVQIKADNSRVTLDLKLDPSLPEKLLSDNNKLTQVLFNLLDNAIKRAGEAGKVSVRAKVINKQKDQNVLHIKIIDNGSVLDKHKITEIMAADRLLQVYSEDQEENKKRQLGMAIVIKLIKTLKGQLNIDSQEEHGTTFSIEVPVSIRKATLVRSGNKPEMPIKILLVEDHFLNQIATKKVLTTWSNLVSVDIAENGLVGVEKFREHGYDLILMDLQMPVMGGLEASSKIRETSTLPIIALTANSSKQEADRCYEVGINDYLAKPFKPQDLYAKILNLLVGVVS